MRIGYARVSTQEQNLDLQKDALKKAGLKAARARGRKGGRPKQLSAQQRALAVDLFRQKKHSISEICSTLGITRPTLYAYVREAGSQEAPAEHR